MALSFTNITDRHGPAVYLLGDSAQSNQQLQKFGGEIDELSGGKTQVVCLNVRGGDGLRIKEFYGLRYFPCVMIVLDDDTVPHQWDHVLPRAKDIIYTLHQISGGVHRS